MVDPSTLYWQRVDRNLGIITAQEQQKLAESCVAIAGCGGMGGLIASTLVRIGIGRIKIADNQVFDLSNINRQFGAKVSTIGKNKAVITAQEITACVGQSGCVIESFPDGITSDNARLFVADADLVCDEIEFFEVKARIALHQQSRAAQIPVLNGNVVGFGTRIFLFEPNGMTMEEFLGTNGDEQLSDQLVRQLLQRLVPKLPPDISEEVVMDWILGQRKAPIFGGTPPLSTGIICNRVCLQLLGLRNRPWVKPLPPMPGYAYFDSATFESGIFQGKWW